LGSADVDGAAVRENGCTFAPDPAEQAARIATAAAVVQRGEMTLGIGIADPELLPLLENTLARAGIAAFNPEGRPRRYDGLYPLLAALADFAAEPAFMHVAALARCPDVSESVAGEIGRDVFAGRIFGGAGPTRRESLAANARRRARAHAGESRLGAALAALAGFAREPGARVISGECVGGADGDFCGPRTRRGGGTRGMGRGLDGGAARTGAGAGDGCGGGTHGGGSVAICAGCVWRTRCARRSGRRVRSICSVGWSCCGTMRPIRS